jgi:tetratricopeptide (TPR) repeat protein
LPPQIALAELSLQTRHFQAALDYCDQILRAYPKHQGARFLRAIALVNLSKPDEARAELTQLQKESPNSAIAKLAMARLDLLQKRLSEAEKQFAELYKVGQPDLRPLDGLMATYVAENQPAKALALVEKELALAPDKPQLIARLAELDIHAGKFSAARDSYQKMLGKDPNSPYLYRSIGEISSRMGDRDTAIRSFQKAVDLDPKDLRNLIELGSLLLSNGQKQEALAVFRKTLALSPDQPAILNNVAYLIADLNGDYKEALDLARKGLQNPTAKADPHLTEHLSDTIGFIYWKQHLNDSAIQTFKSVVQKVPDNPTYHLHYANALLTQGDKSGAKAQLELALMSNPAKDEESEIRTLLARIRQ